MGVPTLFLPDEKEWSQCSPDWAKKLYPELKRQAEEWCKKENIELHIDDSSSLAFDNVIYYEPSISRIDNNNSC